MRNPIPTNRLVAFTLAGAFLTTIVAGGLAFPGIGLTADSAAEAGTETAERLADDAPEPNQDFTPAIKTESGYEEHEENEEYEEEEHEEKEHEEHEEHEEKEHEEHEEHEEKEDEEEYEEEGEYEDDEHEEDED